jgi:biotin-dependent carboxylase-like uncharacterized protein
VFEVIQAGVFTRIQNLGIFGKAHLGIKQSGVMDEYAYRWAEKLLDNCDANALEILLGGFKVKAHTNTTISVCGGDLDFRINGVKKDIWKTLDIYKNDVISFERRQSGMRAYLCVHGGFKSEVSKIVKNGDILNFKPTQSIIPKRVPKRFVPDYEKSLTLNILFTYQDNFFNKKSFLNQEYEITPNINTMGYKLKSEPLIPTKSGIISEGIAFGSVQIPKDGQPIVLLKDRQTIGGYPKIGVVLASDCFKLSQMPIGCIVKFKEIGIEKAESEMREFYRLFGFTYH